MPKYQLIEDSIDDIFNIRIEDGEAAGLVYRYGRVQFLENPGYDQLRIKFNYQLVFNPTELTQEQIESILGIILDDMLQREQAQYG